MALSSAVEIVCEYLSKEWAEQLRIKMKVTEVGGEELPVERLLPSTMMCQLWRCFPSSPLTFLMSRRIWGVRRHPRMWMLVLLGRGQCGRIVWKRIVLLSSLRARSVAAISYGSLLLYML